MAHMPDLRVVPLDRIRRHEEIDPLRVERLSVRIATEDIQVNPMVCIEAPGGELVLLDGATRTESLRRIGLPHAVVQVVEPDSVALGTWHHVIRGCTAAELVDAVAGTSRLHLGKGSNPPSIHPRDHKSQRVLGEELTDNATLSALVEGYVGRWRITRTVNPGRQAVERSFPDWAAIVEFPILTVEDVMTAAVSEDLLPAGITRFKVPDRALRLNLSLDTLSAGTTADDKQAALDRLLDERASEGRVRRYEEPVFVLDD